VPVEQGGKLREGTIVKPDVEHEESESEDSDDEMIKSENPESNNLKEPDAQQKGKRNRARSLLQARLSRKIDEDVCCYNSYLLLKGPSFEWRFIPLCSKVKSMEKKVVDFSRDISIYLQ
jgi:hypothetical protein